MYDDGYGDDHVFSIKNNGGNAASVVLSGGVCQGARTLWAVSPSNNYSSFNLDKQTLTVTVPSSQKITSNERTSDASAMVAVAKITRNATTGAITGNAQFKHVCGFLKFRFGEGSSVTSLVLSSMNGEHLAGTVPVTLSGSAGSETISFGEVSAGVKTITVTPPGSLTFTEDIQYVVPILAQSKNQSGISALSYKYTNDGTDYYGKITFKDNNGNPTVLSRGAGFYGNSTTPMDKKGRDEMSELMATAATANSITLSWKNSSSATAPVRYKIEYDEDEASISDHSAWIDSPGTGATATKKISGLTSGQEYSFRVRAYASDGTTALSGWSPVKKQMTQLPTPTVTVTGTKATGYDVACSCTGAATFNIGVTGSGSYTKAAADYTASEGAYTLVVTDAPRNTTGLVATVTASNSSYDVPVSSSTTGSGRCGYFSGGAGTEQKPYMISSWSDIDDLIAVTNVSVSGVYSFNPASGTNGNSGTPFRSSYYEQTQDIGNNTQKSLSNYIGATRGYPFSGTYDGKGHYIDNYKITNTNYIGIFGVVMEGTVMNLTCKRFVPKSSSVEAALGGQAAIVGYAYRATITNCHYVGTGSETITFDCYHAGGVVGRALDGTTITNCSTRDVTLQSAYVNVGGVAGFVEKGDPFTEGGYTTASASSVQGCFCSNVIVKQTGTTGSEVCVGGIVGKCNDSTIDNCHFCSGEVRFTPSTNMGGVGGIVGKGGNIDVTNSDIAVAYTYSGTTYSADNVSVVNSGGDLVGGIIGQVYTQSNKLGSFDNCRVYPPSGKTVLIEGQSMVGGIAGGYNLDAATSGKPMLTFNKCRLGNATKSITVRARGVGVGGILGGSRDNTDNPSNYPFRIEITRCYIQDQPVIEAQGDDATYGSGTAAIFGRCAVRASDSIIRIFNCLIGSAHLIDLKNSACIGGLIGYLKADSGTTPQFTCQLLNNAFYLYFMYVKSDASGTLSTGAAVGYINTQNNGNDFRLRGFCSDFSWKDIRTSTYPATDAKKFSSEPTSGNNAAFVGYINKAHYSYIESGKTKYNITSYGLVKNSEWTSYFYGGSGPSSDSIMDYSDTYNGATAGGSDACVEFLNGISFTNYAYFTGNAIRWNYKDGKDSPTTSGDQRPYMHWDQTDTRP